MRASTHLPVAARVRAAHDSGCFVCEQTDTRCSISLLLDEYEAIRDIAIWHAFQPCEYYAEGEGSCVEEHDGGRLTRPECCVACQTRIVMREH